MTWPLRSCFCSFAFAAAAFAAAAFAPNAVAQSVLYEYAGPSNVNPIEFGVVAGDWDGDGIADVALMSRYDDTSAPDAGAVEVRSGKDSSLLHTFYGSMREDYFGIPVAMPDVDGDGKPELLVLDYLSDVAGFDRGAAWLFAGGSGTQLWRVDGTKKLLGFAGGPVADVDGDGAPDVYLVELGALRVVSGLTGTLLFSITGAASHDFGYSSANLGDVNGDGADDFLIGAPDADGAGTHRGKAVLYSGADQSVLNTIVGTTDFEHVGDACARIGDVDGDGMRDYVVVARHEDYLAGRDSAVVRVYSAASNAFLGDIRNPPWLFPRIDPVGDANGDGVEDFALLSAATDPGSMWSTRLYSGRTLTRLYSFEHLEPGGFITGNAGDIDGDGIEDLLAGAPFSGGGRFRIYSGSDLWLDASEHTAKANTPLDLATREGVTGNPTVLVLVGIDGTPAFQIVDGLGHFDATGGRVVSGTVPVGLSGHSFDFQSYAVGASGRVIDSAAETIVFP